MPDCYAPLAWTAVRSRGGGGRGLVVFSAVLSVFFFADAITICAYAGATSRYLLEFAPALALLALLGFLGVESVFGGATAPDAAGPAPGRAALSGSALAPFVRAVILGALIYSVAIGWLLALALSAFYRGAERGTALLNSGKIDEGIAAYEGVCRINPDFRSQAELGIGTALLAQGRPKEGIGYLRAAVQEKPGLATAHFNLGRALLALGQVRESAEAFRRAAALDPLDAEAEADLGVALARAGRIGEAIEHLKAALRIDPALEQARRNLQVLESVVKSSQKP